jgi:hypothetical protein
MLMKNKQADQLIGLFVLCVIKMIFMAAGR